MAGMIVGSVLMLIGSFAGAGAVWNAVTAVRHARIWTPAVGEVTGAEPGRIRRQESGPVQLYDYTVRFYALDGREVSLVREAPRPPDLGSQVPVRYHPGDPERAELTPASTVAPVLAAMSVVLIIALLAIGIGLALYTGLGEGPGGAGGG